MRKISMGHGTPSPARVPCLQKTPPGTGISIRAVYCHRKYRLAIYIPAMVTMYNLQATRAANYAVYKPRYFYKYAFSSITIGIRDGKWPYRNR